MAKLLDTDAGDWRGAPATPFYKLTFLNAARNYFDIVFNTILIPTDLLGYPNNRAEKPISTAPSRHPELYGKVRSSGSGYL